VIRENQGGLMHETPAVAALLGADPERATVRLVAAHLVTRLASADASRGHGGRSMSRTADEEVRTKVARYRLRAARVPEGVLGPGPTVVVAFERVVRTALTDADLARDYQLTRREVDVARLVGAGLRTAEIADQLGISLHTARRHSERVFAKLGVRSRAAVAARLSAGEPGRESS